MDERPRLLLLPLILLLILFGGPILRDGLFIDGLAYTNLAKNMAQGIGSIWEPLLEPNGPVFYGHPSLMFWSQSLFFRVFGNHLWTEDIYNTCVLVLTLWFAYRVWGQLVGRWGRGTYWFPLLLFALNQENQLRYPNGMLECSLTMIALGTTYGFILLRNKLLLATLICGFGGFLCFLIKGPVGLFPLGVPFLYYLIVHRRFSWLAGGLPILCVLLLFGLLFALSPAARDHLVTYWDVQVLAALEGKRTEHMAGTRFKIIFALLKSSLIPLAIAGLTWWLKPDTTAAEKAINYRRLGWWMLAVGGSAVLPIMVSDKQASYYQVPSLPFLYLGVSALLLPQIVHVETWLNRRDWNRKINGGLIALTVVAAGYALAFYGTTDKRDVQKIANAARVADALGGEEFRLVVAGPYEHLQDSYVNGVPAYLNRYHDVFVNMDTDSGYTLHVFEEGPRPDVLDGEVVLEFEHHALVHK